MRVRILDIRDENGTINEENHRYKYIGRAVNIKSINKFNTLGYTYVTIGEEYDIYLSNKDFILDRVYTTPIYQDLINCEVEGV